MKSNFLSLVFGLPCPVPQALPTGLALLVPRGLVSNLGCKYSCTRPSPQLCATPSEVTPRGSHTGSHTRA